MPRVKNKNNDNNIITRKIVIYPVGDKQEIDRVYKYIRDGMKAQNLAMNQYMSALYVAHMMDATKEDRTELKNLYQRISTNKKGSAYDENIQFAKGLPTASSVQQKVSTDFNNAMKHGLQYGRLSLPSYKADNPLIVEPVYIRLMAINLEAKPSKYTGLYHNYVSHEEFLDHLNKEDLEVLIKFANNITFKVVFGNPKKSAELRSVFKNIFERTYLVCGSSIGIKDTKIILNLTLEFPKKVVELDERIVVGVDLGIAVPAYCALNINDFVKKRIGDKNDFVRVRTKMQAQYRRFQASLESGKGGHGRKKKLKALDHFKDYESNFVETYNHYVSRQIVEFAIANKAKYINIENLVGIGKSRTNQWVLRNWSYYQLQQYIEYKAKMVGIVVRKVNPYHTSQICSCCGRWEEGQRTSQDTFICKNPNCKNFGKKVNADFNAARNIALSTNFIKDEVTEDSTSEM